MSELSRQWVRAMREGDYELAWAVSEQVLKVRGANGPADGLPVHLRRIWDGRSFEGKRILVRCYRGLGDTIQFARYLPLLSARAGSMTIEVQPRLFDLLRPLAGKDELIPYDPANPLKISECDMEITELAFALRATPAETPPPYLHAPASTAAAGAIGICYRSGDWDKARSVPEQCFRSICTAQPCVTLVSEPTDLPVRNPEGCPFDMETTASLVAGVDLVVTVDTMIAHLAGAMGKPTWLLLKAEPDWRWSPGEASSPWYPSMRLYSQSQPGDWGDVMSRVERDLTTRMERRRASEPANDLFA